MNLGILAHGNYNLVRKVLKLNSVGVPFVRFIQTRAELGGKMFCKRNVHSIVKSHDSKLPFRIYFTSQLHHVWEVRALKVGLPNFFPKRRSSTLSFVVSAKHLVIKLFCVGNIAKLQTSEYR